MKLLCTSTLGEGKWLQAIAFLSAGRTYYSYWWRRAGGTGNRRTLVRRVADSCREMRVNMPESASAIDIEPHGAIFVPRRFRRKLIYILMLWRIGQGALESAHDASRSPEGDRAHGG